METKITINGMHCEACKSLIRMSLEDNGLTPNIKEIEIGGDNEGYVILSNVMKKDIVTVRNSINEMSQYTAVI